MPKATSGGASNAAAEQPAAAAEEPVTVEAVIGALEEANVGVSADSAAEAAVVKPPRVNAPRSEWAAHAVAQGAHPDSVNEMTKAALIAQYGKGASDGESIQ
jgi:hypothetical protein